MTRMPETTKAERDVSLQINRDKQKPNIERRPHCHLHHLPMLSQRVAGVPQPPQQMLLPTLPQAPHVLQAIEVLLELL